MNTNNKTMIGLIDAFNTLPSLEIGKISIIRHLYIEIEAAKTFGYGYGSILATLIEHGFNNTSLNQFYGLLNRIRLERGVSTIASRTVNNLQKTGCNISSNLVHLRSQSNRDDDSSKYPSSLPPTLEDMKEASRTFDIDPSSYE